MRKCFQYIQVIFGSILLAITLNTMVIPLGLYNGGFFGIAQLINALFNHLFNVNYNNSGIISFLLNLPLFILAYRTLSKPFLYKSILSVAVTTITVMIIPVQPLLTFDSILTTIIISGILCGVSIGFVLRAAGSTGGSDILGVYLAKKIPGFTVGRISLIINALIYTTCLIVFDVNTAIYSIIYTLISVPVLDHIHTQNINSTVYIISGSKYIGNAVNEEMSRGATIIKGMGSFTKADKYLYITVISKYEVPILRKVVQSVDKNAFIIINNGLEVYGNFQKRLDN